MVEVEGFEQRRGCRSDLARSHGAGVDLKGQATSLERGGGNQRRVDGLAKCRVGGKVVLLSSLMELQGFRVGLSK